MLDLDGRVMLITGANTGIGRAAARALAARGAHVVLACRDRARAQPALEEIAQRSGAGRVGFLQLDLADLGSVRRAAQEFLARDQPLHVLINNAGVAGQRGRTHSGFELAFGINHVGHFLFTQLLLDRIVASAPSRIVFVSSRAHYRARRLDFEAVRASTSTYTGMTEYSVSKLANVLTTAELARRLEGTGVTTYAVHPGVVASEVWRRLPRPVRAVMNMFLITAEEGARSVVHCATAAELADESGQYYDQERRRTPSPMARDSALAAELWRRSEQWCPAPAE